MEAEVVELLEDNEDADPEFLAWLQSDTAFWNEYYKDWQASPFPLGTAAAIEALTAKLISLEWSALEQHDLSESTVKKGLQWAFET